MLQLNIQSQQSTIDSLNEKAQTLKRNSRDDNLGNQIRQVISRYESLGEKAKVGVRWCIYMWLISRVTLHFYKELI